MTTQSDYDYKYMDHIINIHDMIMNYIKDNALPIYELANSGNFYNFLLDNCEQRFIDTDDETYEYEQELEKELETELDDEYY